MSCVLSCKQSGQNQVNETNHGDSFTAAVDTVTSVVQTCAEAHPERFIGVEAASRYVMNEEYYEIFKALAREKKAPWAYDDFLQRFDSLRSALMRIRGEEKFARIFTFYGVSNPIVEKDGWIKIWLARTSMAGGYNATIFIDTNEKLMYVQWISADEDHDILYYELKDGEKSVPATIMNRKFPDIVMDNLSSELLPNSTDYD